MHKTHTELIKTTEVAILATAHNNADSIKEWIDVLIGIKPKIERHFKNYERPWFATFTHDGDIHIQTVGKDKACRRHRPKEWEVAPAPEVIPVAEKSNGNAKAS